MCSGAAWVPTVPVWSLAGGRCWEAWGNRLNVVLGKEMATLLSPDLLGSSLWTFKNKSRREKTMRHSQVPEEDAGMFGSFKLDETQISETALQIWHLEQYSGFHRVSHAWETENWVTGSFVLTLWQLMPFPPHSLYASPKKASRAWSGERICFSWSAQGRLWVGLSLEMWINCGVPRVALWITKHRCSGNESQYFEGLTFWSP